MALHSSADWIWDCWTADDGQRFHLFFLCASRDLDAEDRHFHARVGHAVSTDLVSWERRADALVPASGGASGYDSRSVWTGSVIREGDGWRMFRTGLSRRDSGLVQRIGSDTSADLDTWVPDTGTQWPLEADSRYYERSLVDEYWRDPWVLRDDDGLWHMYITARVPGAGVGRGVIGHAVSIDGSRWAVAPPLSAPDRFEQVEVISLACIEGRWALIFSCHGAELAPAAPGQGGIWSVSIEGPGKAVDLSQATRLTDETLYAGRLVHDRDGSWKLLAFSNVDGTGAFGGWISDPVPVRWGPAGSLITS